MRSLYELESSDRTQLHDRRKLQRLTGGFSGKKLFAYRGDKRRRLILSFENNNCKIEDILDVKKLARLRVDRGEE